MVRPLFPFINSSLKAIYLSILSVCVIIDLFFWLSFFSRYGDMTSFNASFLYTTDYLLLLFFLGTSLFIFFHSVLFFCAFMLLALFSCTSASYVCISSWIGVIFLHFFRYPFSRHSVPVPSYCDQSYRELLFFLSFLHISCCLVFYCCVYCKCSAPSKKLGAFLYGFIFLSLFGIV